MSQIWIKGAGGGGGGGGLLQLTTNPNYIAPYVAVPIDASQNINLLVEPNGGLQVLADPANSTITLKLANSLYATGQTIGAVTIDLITLPLGAVASTYTVDVTIAGFDATTPAGVGYTIVGAVRTTGAAAILLNTQAVDSFEEAATVTCIGQIAVSGNNLLVRVTGAAGQTINWKTTMNYVSVS